jgi:hypothetical protein
MFGLKAKRRDTQYRQAMRQLQPFATETTSLWLSGYYRGLDFVVPGLASAPQRPRPRRDY